MKSLFTFCVVAVICGFECSKYDFKVLDSIYLEQACTRAGGICTIATDCPEGLLSKQRGLCPKQQKRGIECCYGISVKETRCSKRGGECFEGVNICSSVRYENATDCPQGTTCCILV